MSHLGRFITIEPGNHLYEDNKHIIKFSNDNHQWTAISLSVKELKKLKKRIRIYLKNLEQNENLQ